MTREEALERLRCQCSKAEYCSGQIAERLRRWIFTEKHKKASSCNLCSSDVSVNGQHLLCEEDISHIISVLVDEKFIDDTRFANAFVRDKLKFNGWGRQKIIYRLKSFGISGDTIDKAMAVNYGVERDGASEGSRRLEKLLKKKWESCKKEEPFQNRKARVIRFALGRGFEYNEVLRVLENMESHSSFK